MHFGLVGIIQLLYMQSQPLNNEWVRAQSITNSWKNFINVSEVASSVTMEQTSSKGL